VRERDLKRGEKGNFLGFLKEHSLPWSILRREFEGPGKKRKNGTPIRGASGNRKKGKTASIFFFSP